MTRCQVWKKSKQFICSLTFLLIIITANLLWADTSDGTVSQLTTSGPVPSARSAVGTAALGDDIYFFGGLKEFFATRENTFFNDLYRFNTKKNTWEKLSPTGTPPSPRGHVAAIADKKTGIIYIFGGSHFGKNYQDMTMYNDLWAYSISNNSWRKIEPSTPEVPPERAHPFIHLIDNRLYILAGYTPNWGIVNDMWIFDLATSAWRKLTPKNPAPLTNQTPLGGDVDKEHFIFFDGRQTWEFNLKTTEWKDITPAKPNNISAGYVDSQVAFLGPYMYLQGGDKMGGKQITGCNVPYPQSESNDLWRFDLRQHIWKQLTPAGVTLPKIKWGSGVAVNNKIYYFFGYDFSCPPDGKGTGQQTFNQNVYVFTP
ncbi:N-acetylneuraminic acid mutarotase [Legionella beliardensis]|uniref:N-acetylneuraminic acid mutarotase n=1 Tax=Legionella beliardensis TaxID=91822 RepID=A0A378I075_9GAMM|nr:kelch repeat-containing protein [Legionella beliardensis]STX27976.1 N-acetylneuraminic acid mutarotase [Legionella beliardensis]